MVIPTNETELNALLPKLPRRLQNTVALWCHGHDVSWLFKGLAKSTLYRDRQILARLGLDLSQPHPAPFAPPQRQQLTYYNIWVAGAEDVPIHTVALNEKRELMLSPRGRLASREKAALLDSALLAQALVDHCLPRLRKRYGEYVELEIFKQTDDPRPRTEKRIKDDSEAATAYLARNEKRFPQKPTRSAHQP